MTVAALPLAESAVDPADAGLIASGEFVARAGCTYRQLDFWTRAGYLVPARAAAGSGSQRLYAAAELVVARRMVALVRVGLAPQVAAYAARNGYRTWLSDAVQVVIAPEAVQERP